MVERSLSMREVPGSIPGASKTFSSTLCLPNDKKKFASSGNRTRAARVAGEHSTTEPTMLIYQTLKITYVNFGNMLSYNRTYIFIVAPLVFSKQLGTNLCN